MSYRNLALLFVLALPLGLVAQDVLVLQDHSSISIDGTSTLHDWTMTMEEGVSTGEARFQLNGSAIEGLDQLSVVMPAEGLKSGKVPMDNNTYKALNTAENPDITFVMTRLASIENEGEVYDLEVTGEMSVAGATKEVTLPASCVVDGTNVVCTGSFAFNMTDFGVTPPSVMLGTIKTGDGLVLNYEAVFGK